MPRASPYCSPTRESGAAADDGECQLTINGWPMYYYAKDEQPGDVNGQGVGGIWWATDPKGKRATGAAPGNGNGGYASGGGY